MLFPTSHLIIYSRQMRRRGCDAEANGKKHSIRAELHLSWKHQEPDGDQAYQCSGVGEEIRDEGEHIICEDPEAGHVYSERTEKYL